MGTLKIERGGGANPLTGRGVVDLDRLSAIARSQVEKLFDRRARLPAPRGSEPVYRLTITTSTGEMSVQVPERLVPAIVSQAVKYTLP